MTPYCITSDISLNILAQLKIFLLLRYITQQYLLWLILTRVHQYSLLLKEYLIPSNVTARHDTRKQLNHAQLSQRPVNWSFRFINLHCNFVHQGHSSSGIYIAYMQSIYIEYPFPLCLSSLCNHLYKYYV